jgi:hypothetical protein
VTVATVSPNAPPIYHVREEYEYNAHSSTTRTHPFVRIVETRHPKERSSTRTSTYPLRHATGPSSPSERLRPSTSHRHPFAEIVDELHPEERNSTAGYTRGHYQGTIASPSQHVRIVEARPPSDNPDALYFPDPPPSYEHPPQYRSLSSFPVNQSAGESPT